MTSDSHPTQNVVTCTEYHCVYPTWWPDSNASTGIRFAYNSSKIDPNDDENRLPLDIYVTDLKAKTTKQLTTNTGNNSRPLWVKDGRGPDGTRIYFNSNRVDDLARIYTMFSDGSNQVIFIPDKDSSGNEQKVDDYAVSVLLLN
jgi:hypothetical protein